MALYPVREMDFRSAYWQRRIVLVDSRISYVICEVSKSKGFLVNMKMPFCTRPSSYFLRPAPFLGYSIHIGAISHIRLVRSLLISMRTQIRDLRFPDFKENVERKAWESMRNRLTWLPDPGMEAESSLHTMRVWRAKKHKHFRQLIPLLQLGAPLSERHILVLTPTNIGFSG